MIIFIQLNYKLTKLKLSFEHFKNLKINKINKFTFYWQCHDGF